MLGQRILGELSPLSTLGGTGIEGLKMIVVADEKMAILFHQGIA
jgi:hypothetical protein